MTSKTSCCNGAMLRKTISRFWPLWTGYLLIWLAILPMGLFNDLQYDEIIQAANMQSYIYDITHGCAVAAFLMAPIAAMCVFSHLYNDRSAGAYASLPVTRQSMFLSVTLAGLIPQLLTGLITALVTLGVQASFGVVDLTSILTFLGIFCLHTVTFYGFAVLCAQLTGAMLVVPSVYIVLQFTAVAVQALVYALFDMFLYGYSYSSLRLTVLSPLAKILDSTGYDAVTREVLADGSSRVAAWGFTGWGVCAVYAVSGLVFLVLAFFLYRRRRMESAGDFVSVRFLKPVFKWCLGGGCGLVLTCLMAAMFYNSRTDTLAGMNSAVGALLFLLIGCFIGYFGAEMLMKKTFRVFRGKVWAGFAVCAAVMLVLLCTLTFDLTGFEKRVPDLEDIETASVYIQGDGADFADTANIEKVISIHKGAISTREENEKAYYSTDVNQNYNNHYLTITYHLKNGQTLERTYNLCDTGTMKSVLHELEDLINCREAIAARCPDPNGLTEARLHSGYVYYYNATYNQDLAADGGPQAVAYESDSIALTAKEAYDLYINCIYPDMQELAIGTVVITTDSVYYNESYNASVELLIYQLDEKTGEITDDVYTFHHFTPTTRSLRTNQWLMEHGVELNLRAQTDEYFAGETAAEYAAKYIPEQPPAVEDAEIIVSDNETASIGVIGGADGPTATYVTQ